VAVPSLAVADAGYHQTMQPALDALLVFTEALSADKLTEAQAGLTSLRAALAQAAPTGLSPEAAETFAAQLAAIRAALPADDRPDLTALRAKLAPLTGAFSAYLHTFGHNRSEPLVLLHCPMAFDNRGANWLQPDRKVRNPYFGAAMYRCGEVRTAIGSDGKDVRK
jgi:Cu(I)/Ag(I) efflux system membrane fusion protein